MVDQKLAFESFEFASRLLYRELHATRDYHALLRRAFESQLNLTQHLFLAT